jgi:hypothetical protein
MSAPDPELLRTLTHEQAAGFVGKSFRLVHPQVPQAELSLVAAERLLPNRPRSSRMKRDPFSLYFTGPAEPFLPQGMYTLEGDGVTFEGLFLVPIGRNDDGRYEYEAVFT